MPNSRLPPSSSSRLPVPHTPRSATFCRIYDKRLHCPPLASRTAPAARTRAGRHPTPTVTLFRAEAQKREKRHHEM